MVSYLNILTNESWRKQSINNPKSPLINPNPTHRKKTVHPKTKTPPTPNLIPTNPKKRNPKADAEDKGENVKRKSL